ncbi:hypothetical protein IIG27_004749, partial [Salmonella enterica]|nr:hypothetical protein [Salmonella enterica]
NFSALNTVLEGTAGRNNVGAKLAGNINVTQGNLAVTGTMKHYSGAGFTGLLAQSGLNVNVSAGDLSLTGKTVAFPDGSAQSGNTVALNLTGATLSANHAHLTGSNIYSGSGFILNNVTLNGNIARGNNMTLSSCGSAAAVTNTLYVNGGLGWQAFKKFQTTGIDNNTAVIVTPDATDLGSMGFTNSGDWTFDASKEGAAAGDKAGSWGLTFNNINATTSGNITLTGMSMTNSTLSGSSVHLQGAANGSLSVTNSNLTATAGNITLNTTNASLSVNNSNLNASNGNVSMMVTGVTGNANALSVTGGNITAGQNIALNGTVVTGTGSGVALTNTNMTATAGNISVNGTG